MALDDLYKSLSMFQDGMQKLAINSGIQDATSQVDQINNSMMDEMQKRQAKTQAAQQLALQLTTAGANGQQIQTAMGAIAPQQIRNSQDAYQQAVSTGDAGMMKMAKDMQGFEEGPSNQKLAMQGQNAKDVANIHGMWGVRAANARADGKGAAKLLPAGQVAKITDLDNAMTSANDILSKFQGMRDEVGPWAGIDITKSWTNPEFGDFKAQVGRDFDLYRKAITGAGAGEKEIRMLQENRPTVKDPPDVFEKKINTIRDLMSKHRATTVSNYSKAGYDVGDLMGDNSAAPVQQQQPKMPGEPITRFDVSTGQLEQGFKLPDGREAWPKKKPAPMQ